MHCDPKCNLCNGTGEVWLTEDETETCANLLEADADLLHSMEEDNLQQYD